MERKQRKGTGGGILRPAQTRRGTGRRRLAVLLAVCLTSTRTPDMAPKAAGGGKIRSESGTDLRLFGRASTGSDIVLTDKDDPSGGQKPGSTATGSQVEKEDVDPQVKKKEKFAIKRQPKDQIVEETGEDAVFSVKAGGEELSYQWQRGLPDPDKVTGTFYRDLAKDGDFLWEDIDGADGEEYTFETNEEDVSDAVYRCVVTSGDGELEQGEDELISRRVKVSLLSSLLRTRGAQPEAEWKIRYDSEAKKGTLRDGLKEMETAKSWGKGTIKLLSDVTASPSEADGSTADYVVEKGIFTLDLNGRTLSGADGTDGATESEEAKGRAGLTVKGNAELTVTNSGNSGGIVGGAGKKSASNSGKAGGAGILFESGKLTLKDVEVTGGSAPGRGGAGLRIEGSDGKTLIFAGSPTLTGGASTESTGGAGIHADGAKLKIEYETGAEPHAIGGSGDGGLTEQGVGFKNFSESQFEICSGTYEGNSGIISGDGVNCVIRGGTFKGTSAGGLVNNQSKIQIFGGSFISENNDGVGLWIDCMTSAEPNPILFGGTFSGNRAAIRATNVPAASEYTVFDALGAGCEYRYQSNDSPVEKTAGLQEISDPVKVAQIGTEEQYNLAVGDTYYFDLSELAGLGDLSVSMDMPDRSLNYVPFIYAGTINAYSLENTGETAEGKEPYAHSVFVAEHNLFTNPYNGGLPWSDYDGQDLIFGKSFSGNGVSGILRAPSVGTGKLGSGWDGTNHRGTPYANEWDMILDKGGFIEADGLSSYGQEPAAGASGWHAARGGSRSPRYYEVSANTAGYRPLLVPDQSAHPDRDSLRTVKLHLNGGRLQDRDDLRELTVVCAGTSFKAPSGKSFREENGGSFAGWSTAADPTVEYAAGEPVPESVTDLYAVWKAASGGGTVREEMTPQEIEAVFGGAARVTDGVRPCTLIRLEGDVCLEQPILFESGAYVLDLNGRRVSYLVPPDVQGTRALQLSGNTVVMMTDSAGGAEVVNESGVAVLLEGNSTLSMYGGTLRGGYALGENGSGKPYQAVQLRDRGYLYVYGGQFYAGVYQEPAYAIGARDEGTRIVLSARAETLIQGLLSMDEKIVMVLPSPALQWKDADEPDSQWQPLPVAKNQWGGDNPFHDYRGTVEYNLLLKPERETVVGIFGVPKTIAAGRETALGGYAAPGTWTIRWSIEDAGDTGAVLREGKLTAARAGTVRVKAVIPDGLGESDYMEYFDITVTASAVTGVKVVPATATVQKGGSQTFSATVEGAAGVSQEVTWSVKGGVTGTVIDSAGKLTVSAQETAGTLEVRAVSGEDTSVYGAATVTVTEAEVPAARHRLTVSGSYAAATGAGDYEAGEPVTVRAGSRADYHFTGWTSDGGGSFADAEATETVFTMPDRAVTVTAGWARDENGNTGNHGTVGGGGRDHSSGTIAGPTTGAPSSTSTQDGGTLETRVTVNRSTGTTVTAEIRKDAQGAVTSAGLRVEPGRASVTDGETETKLTVKVDAAAVEAARRIASETVGVQGRQLSLDVEIPEEGVLEQLAKQNGKKLEIEVEIPSGLSGDPAAPVTGLHLSKAAVEAAKAAGRDLTVTVRDETGKITGQWSFDGEELSRSQTPAGDLNLAIQITPVKKLTGEKEALRDRIAAEAGTEAAAAPGLFLSFGDNGILPSAARIRIPAGNEAGIKPGDPVLLYYYNPVTGNAETLPANRYAVDADGYVTVVLSHTSAYVLVPDPARGEAPSGTPTPIAGAGVHVIQKGDTFNKLARLYGCTAQELMALNPDLRPYDLRIGQEVRLPVR